MFQKRTYAGKPGISVMEICLNCKIKLKPGVSIAGEIKLFGKDNDIYKSRIVPEPVSKQ